jgi:predicted phage tail protein
MTRSVRVQVAAVVASFAVIASSVIFLGTTASAAPLTGEVTITGAAAPGRTITANPIGWEPDAVFTYSWTTTSGEVATTRNIKIPDNAVVDDLYRVSVTAHKEGFEDGTANAQTTVQQVVPGVPQGLTATPNGRNMDLAWTAPTNTGGRPLATYRVQFRPAIGGAWQTFTHDDSTATTITVTGLVGATDYSFRVSAVNAVGPGTPSRAVTAKTGDPDIPTAIPAAPVAVAGNRRATLTWQPPANAAAAAPVTYKIECYRYSGGTGATATATGFPYREWKVCVPDTGVLTPNSAGTLRYVVTDLPR